MSAVKIEAMRERIFKRHDEICAVLEKAGISVRDTLTLLAMLTHVHTAMSHGLVIAEAAVEELGKMAAEAEKEKEKIH